MVAHLQAGLRRLVVLKARLRTKVLLRREVGHGPCTETTSKARTHSAVAPLFLPALLLMCRVAEHRTHPVLLSKPAHKLGQMLGHTAQMHCVQQPFIWAFPRGSVLLRLPQSV